MCLVDILAVYYCQVLLLLPSAAFTIAKCCFYYCQVLLLLPGAFTIDKCFYYCQVLLLLLSVCNKKGDKCTKFSPEYYAHLMSLGDLPRPVLLLSNWRTINFNSLINSLKNPK